MTGRVNDVEGGLRELAEKAELAYREYGQGACPTDAMFEAREAFEAAADPETVLALLDVAEVAETLSEDEESQEGGWEPDVTMLGPLRKALARWREVAP